MSDVLTRIAEGVRSRMDADRRGGSLLRELAAASAARRRPHRFRDAIRGGAAPRVIAEIKAASPSAGTIVADPDVAAIARAYRAGGAAAISIVAEEEFFRGSQEWIGVAARESGLPVLMKHFVTDDVRLVHAGIAAGADAILLIAALLPEERLRGMIAEIESFGRDALVEVHDEEELGRAIAAGASLIGVNNRDLRTFAVELATSERLSGRVPRGVVKVAESGIRSAADAERMGRSGFDAVLVGEHLLRQEEREAAVRALAGTAVKVCGITREGDALEAAAAGASFLGFVFAEGSPRRIEPERARAIGAAVRESGSRAKLVGVFRDADAATIARTAAAAELDFVQLHGDEPASLLREVPLPAIRAVRVGGAAPSLDRLGLDHAAWTLFDAASPGSGRTFDWSLLAGLDVKGRVMLAGGVTPENVAEAVARVRPAAIDVSSGVETSPGIKSAARIRALFEEVRRA